MKGTDFFQRFFRLIPIGAEFTLRSEGEEIFLIGLTPGMRSRMDSEIRLLRGIDDEASEARQMRIVELNIWIPPGNRLIRYGECSRSYFERLFRVALEGQMYPGHLPVNSN